MTNICCRTGVTIKDYSTNYNTETDTFSILGHIKSELCVAQLMTSEPDVIADFISVDGCVLHTFTSTHVGRFCGVGFSTFVITISPFSLIKPSRISHINLYSFIHR